MLYITGNGQSQSNTDRYQPESDLVVVDYLWMRHAVSRSPVRNELL